MKDYIMPRIFKASTGIARSIFVTLGIGLLIENIGRLIDSESLIQIGNVAKNLMAPSIGVGIAFMLGANLLTIMSAMITSSLGAGAITFTAAGFLIKSGEPIGALLAATLATYIGKRISGKTPVDMMIVPLGSILIAGWAGLWLSGAISPILTTVAGFIKDASSGVPFVSSIVISVVWGLLLLSPASSVALAVALNMDGLIGGAALAGCAAHFIGFSLISARENNLGGILAQLICTPKIQLPNITKNIWIVVPSVIAGAIAGPVSFFVFGIEVAKEYAGLGLCSLIVPIHLLTIYPPGYIILAMLVTYLLIPGVISYLVYLALWKKEWIRPGDLRLPE
ncbi:PTS transporter subunit IIC [Brevibacillus daliensis]|uniref:PTS transporter subunit IIC n=1 Tax=Brevibacillus daliensis TaxID=2892995 RepID=UPI001E5AD78E|nr:PTS sugar transporter subunit IIC [Brevibacillus daliensis]